MTDVIALNLTDLCPDGESDPLSECVLEIAVAAAKVVTAPMIYSAARASLETLRRPIPVVDEPPHFAELIDAVLRTLVVADREFGDPHGR